MRIYNSIEEASSENRPTHGRFRTLDLTQDPATLPRRERPVVPDELWSREEDELWGAIGGQRSLGCDVDGIHYDPNWRKGKLYMPAGHCCDMSACLELFTEGWPAVKRIETFSGNERDTTYVKRGGRWHSFAPEFADCMSCH